MKTIILIAAIGILIFGRLTGQTNIFYDPVPSPAIDTSIFTVIINDPFYSRTQEDNNFRTLQTNKSESHITKNFLNSDSPLLILPDDRLLADKFPGSDRYFSKRQYLIIPNDSTFAIRPDTSAKYHLIIKDPFTWDH